jgi:glycosyltransferase involved in cell wall biosynthesis
VSLKIAYLTLEAPREGQASYAHVVEIVNGLRDQGFAVDLYLPTYSDNKSRPGLLRKLSEYMRLQLRLFSMLGAYDLIYIRAHNCALPIAFLAKIRKIPVVHEVNGPYTDILLTYRWLRFFAGLIIWLQRIQYRHADGLIVVTPQLEEFLRRQRVAAPVTVIPNGANLRLFNPRLSARSGLPPKYVVFFGGFARWQGIEVILNAVSSQKWPSSTSLVLVGDGQLTEQVQSAAAGNSRIRYLGRVPYAQVGEIVVGAIAGLVPKTRGDDLEQTGILPIKLFEILACGKPAIITDYPGQADLVRSLGCGLIISPNDPTALARAVAELAERPDIAAEMGRRGHDYVARQHTWTCRAKDTAAFLSKIVQGARTRAHAAPP